MQQAERETEQDAETDRQFSMEAGRQYNREANRKESHACRISYSRRWSRKAEMTSRL
jgi:hypothetical protein